ncbi:MAG TPA: RNA-binding cell elongation regulator Jag/EloR [Candidatus Limnocylindrales bacterium]|nr:RNA-binding cell elongation regulator Jag/EloR [Candidatus Limnocylindrales bacterium]
MTTGRTVAEAVESALDKLGVDEQDAEIEVVQEPQKGLFGRLRAEAQVRARVRPTVPRPKVDRRDRRRGERRGRDGDRNRAKARSAGRSDGNDGNGRGRGQRRDASTVQGDGDGRDDAAVVAAHADLVDDDGPGSVEGHRPASTRSRRRRGGRTPEGANAVSESTQPTQVPTAVEFDIEGQRQAVEGFLIDLLAAFGRSDATVAVAVSEDEAIEASVDGPELGLLVGQKGVTLQAVQELVRSMVQRRFVGQAHARVRLDVAGYRARRKVALERFALEVAESVKASGVAKALDPMGSADRKIVHDAVNEMEGVSTVSEGEDAARRVVIRPA